MIWCMVYCVDVCIVVLTLTFLFLWRLCSFQIWLRGNDGYAVVWKKTSRSTRLQVLYVTRALVYGSRTSGASNSFFFFCTLMKVICCLTSANIQSDSKIKNNNVFLYLANPSANLIHKETLTTQLRRRGWMSSFGVNYCTATPLS